MAGYGSQNDYEAELLQTYLRKGRVSPIARRDVDLALSIYRMPRRGVAFNKQAKLTYDTAKKSAKGKTDLSLMQMATTAVLNKAGADRRTAAAAKAKGTTVAPTAAAPAGSYRPPTAPPPPPPPVRPPYSGSLTPPNVGLPYRKPTTTRTTLRRPRTGTSGFRPTA